MRRAQLIIGKLDCQHCPKTFRYSYVDGVLATPILRARAIAHAAIDRERHHRTVHGVDHVVGRALPMA